MVAVGVPAVPLLTPPASTKLTLCVPAVNVGASFVPVMLTVITCVVPSAVATVTLSLYSVPPTNSLCALLAVYVHAPSVPMLNFP